MADAIAIGADTIDADALAKQVRRYRSAALIGLSVTASGTNPVMR